jgi:hypothetical protein
MSTGWGPLVVVPWSGSLGGLLYMGSQEGSSAGVPILRSPAVVRWSGTSEGFPRVVPLGVPLWVSLGVSPRMGSPGFGALEGVPWR